MKEHLCPKGGNFIVVRMETYGFSDQNQKIPNGSMIDQPNAPSGARLSHIELGHFLRDPARAGTAGAVEANRFINKHVTDWPETGVATGLNRWHVSRLLNWQGIFAVTLPPGGGDLVAPCFRRLSFQ